MSPSQEANVDSEVDSVETELNLIRRHIREYSQQYEDQMQKKRAENVHVLVAVSVLGGYATIYPSVSIRPQLWSIVSQIFVALSAVFLLAKLTTITFRPVSNRYVITYIDEIVEPIVYILSIYGILSAGIVVYLLDTFDLGQNLLVNIISVILVVTLLLVASAYYTRLTIDNLYENELGRSEYIYENIDNILTRLVRQSLIGPKQAQAFRDRLEGILIPNQDYSLIDKINILLP